MIDHKKALLDYARNLNPQIMVLVAFYFAIQRFDGAKNEHNYRVAVGQFLLMITFALSWFALFLSNLWTYVENVCETVLKIDRRVSKIFSKSIGRVRKFRIMFRMLWNNKRKIFAELGVTSVVMFVGYFCVLLQTVIFIAKLIEK